MQKNFETARLKFRPVRAADAHFFYQLDSNPRVMKYINGGKPLSLDEVKQYVPRITARDSGLNGLGLWMAFLKGSDEFVGWYALKPLPYNPEIEIGYRLREEFWGQGLATEGATYLLEYGFEEMKLPLIVAITDTDNLASKKVLGKIGLEYIDDRKIILQKDPQGWLVSWFEARPSRVKYK